MEFNLLNNNLLIDIELLEAIHNTLFNNKEFLNFGKNKIFIVTAISDNIEFNFHPNILVNNYTSVDTYIDTVKDNINNLYKDNKRFTKISIDIVEAIPLFKIIVWNMDSHDNKNIKITKNSLNKKINMLTKSENIGKRFYSIFIKPVKKDKAMGIISTLDVETMEFENKQIPVLITLANKNNVNKIFIINQNLIKTNILLAINDLWNECFNYILDNKYIYQNLFVHNLGAFDGYFIYKHLCEYANSSNVSTIIDDKNKFIQIVWKCENNFNIYFKDSFRIFPISLDDLCKQFDVKGKLCQYNPIFNTLDIFKPENNILLNKFKDYAMQDSEALLNALLKAQELYFEDYKVDITTILSAPSLSLKIFRSKFLDKNIPVLTKNEDNYIRNSYFGGATDYYKAHVTNLHYYDVNSLYPKAMLNPMPYKIKKFHKDLSKTNLNNFFGFCLVEVQTPKNIIKPLLPYRYNGKTIFPIGTWKGIYFSEELKALIKYGYKFRLINGIEFYATHLFNEYVNHFYDIKKNTSGSKRFIAKLHLNMLYGIFGRKLNLIETINVHNDEIINYCATLIIKGIIKINDNISTLLVENNLNYRIITDLNNTLNTNLISNYHSVKANVAIASAITAYARIFMMQFKLDDSCVYSDTDSLLMTKKLDDIYLGNDIGLFKDELNGIIIQEAYILGIKQYGYWYYDNNNNKIEKSVFAGIERDTIPFNDIIKIFNGDTLYRDIPTRYFKSLNNLNISIKPIKLTLKRNYEKKIISNNYLPKEIDDINQPLNNNKLFIKLYNKVKKWINKYNEINN
jgi:hypothetical protein